MPVMVVPICWLAGRVTAIGAPDHKTSALVNEGTGTRPFPP